MALLIDGCHRLTIALRAVASRVLKPIKAALS
jgi:hypothetical protein